MKKKVLIVFCMILFLCSSCKSNDIVLEEDPVIDPTPTPTAEMMNDPELVKVVEELFLDELSYYVPEEMLDPASMVNNAMLDKTEVIVHSALDDSCEVTIRYPDVASALLEEIEILPDDADQAQWDELFLSLFEKIDQNEISILEEHYTVGLQRQDDELYLELTDELINALTEGLYLMGGDE